MGMIKKRHHRLASICILLTLRVMASLAEEPELVTDRPDFTESAVVVPRRSIQLETGFEYAREQNDHSMTLPNVLIRMGIHPIIEMRFGGPGLSWFGSMDNQSHFNDISLEAKIQLGRRDAPQPFALIVFTTFPTGTSVVSSGKNDFGLRLSWANDLSESSSIGINLGGASIGEKQKRLLNMFCSASYGHNLTDRTACFVESYAEITQRNVWVPVVDGGFTFSIASLYQLDLYAGKGLNSAAPSFTVGAGFCCRL